MGDRANVVVRDRHLDLHSKEAVFLYTHWDGMELPELLRVALAREERWDDEQYLARIVFQVMLGGNDGETGYGISTRIGDNSYPLLVLCMRRVYLLNENEYHRVGFDRLEGCPSLSFEEYINVPDGAQRTWESVAAEAQVESSTLS